MPDIFAAHAVNRYLWSKLKSSGAMVEANYDGIVPLSPVEKGPELTKEMEILGNPPFIVYSWTLDTPRENWWITTEQIAYMIYARNTESIRTIKSLMIEEFRRYDESAQDVQAYLDSTGGYNGFDFKSIRLITAGSVIPLENQETELRESLVSIAATYVRTY